MSLTRQEVFQALADGKTIELKNPSWADYRPLDHTNYLPLKSDSFNNYDWRIKPKTLEWYENIPEHGVLVRSKNTKSIYVAKRVAYPEECTPLTNEEIEQFLRGE